MRATDQARERACGARSAEGEGACGCRAPHGREAGLFYGEAFGWLRRALAALVLAGALTTTLVPGSAFADDDENLVNPQQRPDSSFIYDTSIAALGNADAYYDNQTVQVVGEVIGDAINADWDGSHKWVTLFEKDGKTGQTATVSVFMTSETAARIDTFGAYGKTGTTLQVRGTFHLVCPEHEGLSDLHASHVSIVRKGTVKPDELDPKAFVPGAVCLAVGLLVMFAYYRLRERQR